MSETILDIIKTRRSTRKFKSESIPEDMLDQIIEAGRYAPSGCNVQTAHFIVVKNAEVLNTLKELVKLEFAKMEIHPDTFGSIANSINASRHGDYTFHYNTPVLIIAANSIENPNAIADTACAINSMMLEANYLDLGTCWINQLRWLNENPVINEYLYSIGMEKGERVYGSLAIGYPDTDDGKPEKKPLERFGNTVTDVE